MITRFAFLIGLAISFGWSTIFAELPQEVTPRHFQSIVKKSPFTRSLNVPNTMILTGFAELENGKVAFLVDPKNGESFLVSEKENSMGWKLEDVSGINDLENAIATISRGDGVSFRVSYDKKVVQEISKKKMTRVADTKGKQSDYRQGDERKQYYEDVRKKMSQLNQAQQAEVRKIMAEKYKANPKMSPRDRGTMYMKVLDYVRTKK